MEKEILFKGNDHPWGHEISKQDGKIEIYFYRYSEGHSIEIDIKEFKKKLEE